MADPRRAGGSSLTSVRNSLLGPILVRSRHNSFQTEAMNPEAMALLSLFVEASRRLPAERREPFALHTNTVRRTPDYPISHPGIQGKDAVAYPMDLTTLERRGLIHVTRHGGLWQIDVTHEGFTFYGEQMSNEDSHLTSVERELRAFIEAPHLRSRFPDAIAKWKKAEALLWEADPADELTAIGHHCREALQLFAVALEKRYSTSAGVLDQAKTVARIRAVIAGRLPSQTTREFADALLAYWGSVSDLVQRQEHGAGREGELLGWHDARRIVFQTLVVMNEIEDALDASK